MTPQEIKLLLARTLDDRRLTRSERRGLSQVLDDDEPNEHSLAVYRHAAFELAKETLSQADSGLVLDWLEEAVRLFQPKSAASRGQLTAESLFSPNDDCATRITHLLQHTSRSVDICVFTITDNRISCEILATHRRGIAVRIITDDDKSTDKGSDVERLSQAGISIRVDRTRYHMHHKFALFDQRLLLTGSYNWTRSAAQYNEENFIITSEQRFIRSFSNEFQKLWNEFSPQ